MDASSVQRVWEAALGELQIQVNKPNYQTWLARTRGLSFQNNQFIVGVPNTFVAEYLDRNQRFLIEKVLTGLLRSEVEVQFQVDNQPGPLYVSGRHKPVPPQQACLPLFNARYTFDSFVPGICNQFAYAAALQVAQNPGNSYNPLYIYGGAGTGKTHLLQAIGQTATVNNLKVLYVSAEQYTNDLMSAIRDKSTDDFCGKYRSVDMLLVDDVQFFSGKEKTAENFFHTFNELHNTSRQIAITSDRPPKAMPLLPDRLRSRFEWGLVTVIKPPDFKTRLAILEAKAKQEGIPVSMDVLELIAGQIEQNIRALEGSLNRVVMYAKLLRAVLTPDLAARALKDIADNQPEIATVTPCLIVEAVANCFQLAPPDLIGKRRDKEAVMARRVAMYLLRQETSCSLAQIGEQLGKRDAAAVTNACKKIASDLDTSPFLKRKILDIQRKIHPEKS
ncbi:MAG: chromosomal replication initiator protein DnaA [Chloroflexi bacterium]|nr:chromosomal replication initiator protein DnaA [Chloroflexota bacterium]